MKERNFHLGLKAAIHRPDGLILMVQKNLPKPFWEFPGGRIQVGEDPETALRREILEETGLSEIADVRPSSMILTQANLILDDGSERGLILWYFDCRLKKDPGVTLSSEHLAFEWLPLQEIMARFSKQGHAFPQSLVENR